MSKQTTTTKSTKADLIPALVAAAGAAAARKEA